MKTGFSKTMASQKARDFPERVFLNYKSKMTGLLRFQISSAYVDGSIEQNMHVPKMAGKAASAKSRLVWCGLLLAKQQYLHSDWSELI